MYLDYVLHNHTDIWLQFITAYTVVIVLMDRAQAKQK
jgi:hypothetical protein